MSPDPAETVPRPSNGRPPGGAIARTALRVASAVLCLLALSSCYSVEEVEVFNNSGVGVLVTACGKSISIGDGVSREIRALCGRLPPVIELSVLRVEKTWSYSIPIDRRSDHSEYIKFVRENRHRVQLERSGLILAVPVDAPYPLAAGAPQPAGFPIVPSSQQNSPR